MLPGGYSIMSIRPSLPGKSVRSFEKSGVTFASLSFADESSAAALRHDRARTAIPRRNSATSVAAFGERFDGGADCGPIAFFCGALRLSHSAKRMAPRRGLVPGTRL